MQLLEGLHGCGFKKISGQPVPGTRHYKRVHEARLHLSCCQAAFKKHVTYHQPGNQTQNHYGLGGMGLTIAGRYGITLGRKKTATNH